MSDHDPHIAPASNSAASSGPDLSSLNMGGSGKMGNKVSKVSEQAALATTGFLSTALSRLAGLVMPTLK